MKHIQRTGIQIPGFPKVIINKLTTERSQSLSYLVGICSFCDKDINDGFYVVIASSTICHYKCFLDFIDQSYKNKDSIEKQMMIHLL